MWKIAFATLGCPDWDLPTVVSRARTYGYDGVELRGGTGGHVAPELTLPERTAVRRLCADHGVEVAAIAAYTRFAAAVDVQDQRRQEETLTRFVELAADLGAPVVRTFGGDLAPGEERIDAVARVAESLNRCAIAAEDHGVTIALETHDAFSRGEDVADVLAVVPSPAVGALWDLLHPFRHGEQPEETAAVLHGRIRHVHVKDGRPSGRGSEEAWDLVELGRGDLPAQRMLELLQEEGYGGYLSLEWEKQWHPELADPEEAFPYHARVLRDYMAALMAP